MKNLSVKLKMTLAMGSIITVMLVGVILAIVNLNAQKDDGLIINLAGRQRMLIQKMSKELAYFYTDFLVNGRVNDDAKTKVNNTMEVFSMTLHAITNSGEAPLDLNLKTTKYRDCPKSSGIVKDQLNIVNDNWKKFEKNIMTVLESSSTGEESFIYVKNNNLQLLGMMNKAVGMMQAQSELHSKTIKMILMTTLFVIVVIGLFSIMVILDIVKSISRFVNFSEGIAKGDFNKKIEVNSTNELGRLAQALKSMQNSLKTNLENQKMVTEEVNSNINTLGDASDKLSSVSQELDIKTQDIIDQSNLIASAAEELSINMGQISDASENSKSNLDLVSSSTTQMSEAINEVSQNTESARHITADAVQNVKRASKEVNELEKAAKEISQVTDTILEIAEQTKLLALNATIEAARAGEAGKGFAVVANEVKDLASQTNMAIEDIQTRIEAIQSTTGKTITEINNVSTTIEDVNEIVNSIATAVEEQNATTNEISANILSVTDNITDVVTNVVEAASATNEVASNVVSVNTSINDIGSTVSQLNISTKDIEATGKQLKEMSGKL